MYAVEQWLESWADNIDEETGELISEGGKVYCMLAVASKQELELLRSHYKRSIFATTNHGKHPVTGDWDSDYTTFNVQWKTHDAEEFDRLGGSKIIAELHGYDVHPNKRK